MTSFGRFAVYARGIVGDLCLVAITLALCPLAMAAGVVGWRKGADRVILFWGQTLLWLFGLRVRVSGLENFPDGLGCLILFNHQSLLDIPVLYGSLRRTIRFGAKTELFRIPLFGPAMKAVGTLPIARADRAGTMQVYAGAESMFAKGFSYALAPEGTRQSEPEIGTFKKGPFLFAIGAGAPIVPAVIKGAHEALPKKRLVPNLDKWRRVIDLQLLPQVNTVGLNTKDVSALSERVRSAMLEAYAKL